MVKKCNLKDREADFVVLRFTKNYSITALAKTVKITRQAAKKILEKALTKMRAAGKDYLLK